MHTEIHAHSGGNDIIEEEKMQYEGEEEEKQGGGEHDLKSQFMSTAPVKITYGNSTYNKHFMNIKETKQELKTYSR